MKELIRFRQFLAEGKINESKIDDLLAALEGHAKDVVSSGKFFTVSQFGSGYDENPPVNVTEFLENEMENTEKDSQYYEDLEMDLEASKQIAYVVANMGGKVSYISPGEGDTPNLKFVYSVNPSFGDLVGQAIVTDEEIEDSSSKEWTPKGFAFIFRTNDQGKEQFEQAKSILQNQGIPFEEDSEANGEIALNFSGTQDVRDLKQILGDNGVGRYTIGSINQYK